MPEGPSLILAAEDFSIFKGQKILSATGSSKIDMERLEGARLRHIRTWGKHLLLCFDGFTLRIHFLMFGTWYINAEKDKVPKLSLQFSKDYVNLYACAIRVVDEPLDEYYDWSADVLNEAWDAKKARVKLKAAPDMLVADALLDQQIFSGVGNIIKNEVLYRIKVHPSSEVGALPPAKLTALIREARQYSLEFLQWKREGTLRQHWLAHTKKICARDGNPMINKHVGTTDRRSFFCNCCQVLYR